jgi:hypothetical protein
MATPTHHPRTHRATLVVCRAPLAEAVACRRPLHVHAVHYQPGFLLARRALATADAAVASVVVALCSFSSSEQIPPQDTSNAPESLSSRFVARGVSRRGCRSSTSASHTSSPHAARPRVLGHRALARRFSHTSNRLREGRRRAPTSPRRSARACTCRGCPGCGWGWKIRG